MPAGLSSWAEIHAWRPNVVQIQLKKRTKSCTVENSNLARECRNRFQTICRFNCRLLSATAKNLFKKNSWRDSSLRSCYRVWTIVTTYLPDSQRLHWRHYSGYCTLPLELSWTSDHATATMCLPPCVNCTGCRSSRGLSSSCACSSTSH